MGQHHVKQTQPPSGSIPASSIVSLSDDSKYLFKLSLKQARQHGFNPYQFYAAILSGTPDEINGVINQSQNNTYDYTSFDPTTYSGQCKAPVEALFAAHPIPPHTKTRP